MSVPFIFLFCSRRSTDSFGNTAEPALPGRWYCPRRGGWRSDTQCAKTGGASSKPAFAALVALYITEALAVRAAHAEVELLHILVLAQALGLAVHHDAAVLQDVAVVGVAQRHVGVLLGQEEGHF